jgi:flagellar biosynthetic protein FliR
VNVDAAVATAFVLALVRTSAWVMAAPVFSMRGISSVGRLALAIALAVFLAPLIPVTVPPTAVDLLVLAVAQAAVGLVLGFGTGLLLHAFEAAGTAMDVSSGFAVASLIDPLNGAPSAIFSRFANLLFIVLLMATDAHHTLIEGFVRSFRALPLDRFPALNPTAVGSLGHAVTNMIIAALEIGAPVLGALFLTEVALAIAGRFAPQANVFVVGLPLKVLVSLLALGSALVFIPGHITGLLDHALKTGASLLR